MKLANCCKLRETWDEIFLKNCCPDSSCKCQPSSVYCILSNIKNITHTRVCESTNSQRTLSSSFPSGNTAERRPVTCSGQSSRCAQDRGVWVGAQSGVTTVCALSPSMSGGTGCHEKYSYVQGGANYCVRRTERFIQLRAKLS